MRIPIQLECGCVTIFPSPIPMIGDALTCSVHGGTTRVSSPEWFIRCQDCRYSKGFGNARLTAETKASAHSCKRGHTLKVWRRLGRRVDKEFTVPSIPHKPLNLPSVEPAF